MTKCKESRLPTSLEYDWLIFLPAFAAADPGEDAFFFLLSSWLTLPAMAVKSCLMSFREP